MAATNLCQTNPTPATAGKADTNNWDTVFAITFKNANTAITKAGSSPPGFSGIYTDGLSGSKYTVAANFGAWQLVGGSGALVHMALPLTDGKVTLEGGSTSITFNGSATIEVHLDYLPQPETASAASDTKQYLKVKTTTTDPNTDPIVSIQSVSLDNENAAGAVQEVLDQWLLNNLQTFNHVFTVVDINVQAAKDQFQWLKPTKVGYAVNAPEAAKVEDYIFGVLAMTEHRPGTNLSAQISPNIIPTGANAGFLIAQERFLEKIMMPNMAALFKGATVDDFELTDDNTIIRNKNTLSFQNFELENGGIITNATIDAQKFTLEARASTLLVMFDDLHFGWDADGNGGGEGSPYVVHLTYSGESELFMDTNHHFQMCTVNNPSLETVVTKTEAEKWAEIIAGLIEGIAFAVIGAAIGGALGPAAEEAAEGLQTAGSDAAEGVTDADGSVGFGSDVNLPADDDIANLDDVNSDENSNASDDIQNDQEQGYKSKFKGWFRRNWRKMLGMAIGGAIGVVTSKLPDILEAYAEKNLKDIPTLDEFTEESVAPVTWPNSSGYEMVSVALNESLQIGLNLHFDN